MVLLRKFHALFRFNFYHGLISPCIKRLASCRSRIVSSFLIPFCQSINFAFLLTSSWKDSYWIIVIFFCIFSRFVPVLKSLNSSSWRIEPFYFVNSSEAFDFRSIGFSDRNIQFRYCAARTKERGTTKWKQEPGEDERGFAQMSYFHVLLNCLVHSMARADIEDACLRAIEKI